MKLSPRRDSTGASITALCQTEPRLVQQQQQRRPATQLLPTEAADGPGLPSPFLRSLVFILTARGGSRGSTAGEGGGTV